MSRSEANAFVKKLRKDEEKYDDLWIAADNATDDDEDGFASRYAKGDYASGYGGSNAVDPDWEFPSNFEPRGQNEDDYLSLPKEVREMLWDMTMEKRKNIGSWEDYYRESISLGASYRVPNVENQPNALNAWQLLAPSEGQRGQSGAYKQWNVKIVTNARDGYDVVKSFGKLEDGDAISPRSNRGSLREQKIGTTLNYGRALEMARQAVSEKVNEGKGYRVTRTNDRGARSEQNIGPGLTQTEKDVAKAVATMRSGTVGSPRMSSQSAGDGFASRMPNDGERILKRGNRDFLSDEFSPSEYRMAMSGLDKVRKGDGKVSPQEEAAIRKLANLYRARPTIKPNERFAINEVLNNVNSYANLRGDGFASRSMSDSARNPDGDTFKSFKKVIARESGYEFDDLDDDYQEESYNAFLDGTADPVMIANDIADEMDALSDDYKERQIGFGSRGDSGEGFASSADEDRLVAAWRATSKKLDEPVVRGEKSPILDMSSLDFDSHRGGGSKFTPRSESTYDIYGPVNMPIYQPEAVFTTQFADQIVKDFSRSDLTIEELADRFDLTPTQVYEVLDNAKEDMLILDGIRAGKYRSDPYQIKNLEKVEKIFVGDRKHTDIPEPTGEALAKKERRMEIQRADAANDITRQNYSDALKKLKYTDEYTQAETGYNKTRRENEQREYWLEKNRLLQNNIDDLEGTDEDNLSILTGALAGDDILEILQDSGVDFRDPTSDWYEDDNGTMRDGDGDEVSYEDLEWDSFDIDLESLSAEERQKLSDEVESTKNLIRTRAQDARKELGLSENPNSTDIRMAVKAGNTVAREPITKLENELSKKFPLVPVPEEQKRSSLYGFVDADGNKVDYRKLATQYEKIQEARRAEYLARREEEGLASRSTTKPSVDAETQKNIERASLGQLANMIQDDLDEQGKKLYFGAVPYIDALSTMDSMDDRYGADSAQSIVAYTLSNLSTYKGAKARAIKAELKKRLDAKVDKDGFGSRGDSYKKYDSGWDGIIQSLETSPDMNAARAFPSWDDLDYDEQNEFVHEVDYDYMFDNHGDLGDDGIVEAMEDGTYDDAINEHAAMVWDTITERKEKERLTAAVTGPAKESATGTFYTVDHWYNNDARHDEFLDRADGNLGEAMNMSYEEFLDGFASMGSDDEELFYDDERRPRRGSRRFASDSEYGEDNEEAANMRRRDDGFASRGSDLSEEDKKEIISVASAMGNRYTNSVVGQYNRDGDLSDAQWGALDRMTKRFDKESGEYVRNTRLVEKRQAERDARLAARGRNTSDGFASIYPKDEDGLERFINQQELELEDYAIMSELEPDKYPISGLESTKKRIATAKRDLARIQKNKPQPVEEDEEFLASIDGFASSSTREADFPDDYEADMTDIAAQDVASNFTRLSKDDQNMYFQRALTNNADSGMTTDQILDEARKLAMDDRQMAILERQAIGMGGSSKPRKLDVSSSSALNSVSYDEMNESLQVEYRGRDGQGTGTLYTYEGVTPDVVDRIEAADSRGATMREIRDNFEFTTSRKLPDSAYEGLASRSETERLASWKPVLRDLRSLKDRVNGNEINDGLIGVGDMDVKPGSDFFRGRQRAYMGLMDELDEIIANAQEEGNLDLEGPTEK